ncbi:MAG: hypothetical protein BHW45_11350 [Roseburia sp. CAG:197_41_10]|nr:MAG: hypothetical protein BHW45_11350 [Roseburia sp. CAG:197_41_10]
MVLNSIFPVMMMYGYSLTESLLLILVVYIPSVQQRLISTRKRLPMNAKDLFQMVPPVRREDILEIMKKQSALKILA